MEYRFVETEKGNYLECLPVSGRIENENDALDLVAACGENGTDRLMIHAGNLGDDFYDLKTGLAGSILLKFANYYIKVAAVLTPELGNQGRFREMVLEANRSSREFRGFYDREVAEGRLLG
jgi:hypothetical protein